jgi:hypothetical protein
MIVRAVLVSLCMALTAAALAQESKPTAPAPQSSPTAAPAKPEATKDTKPEAKDAAAAEDPAAKDPAAKDPAAKDPATPATKPTKDSAGTAQRFIPSEQVRSDFDVSFPVDI